MSLFPGNSEFYEALLEMEQRMKDAPPDPEDVVLLRRLARALDVTEKRAQLVALRVLTKCIRDGSVSRSDLRELRESPLPEAQPSPGMSTTTYLPSGGGC